MDKYLTLARDAASQGDRIAAENYLQHADHYYRVVYARNEQQEARRRANGANDSNDSDGSNGDPIPVQGAADTQGPVDLVQSSAGTDESKGSPSDETSGSASDNPDNEADKGKKPRRGRPRRKAAGDDEAASEAAE